MSTLQDVCRENGESLEGAHPKVLGASHPNGRYSYHLKRRLALLEVAVRVLFYLLT